MRRPYGIVFALTLFVLFVLAAGAGLRDGTPGAAPEPGVLVFTQLPVGTPLEGLSARFPAESRLARLDTATPGTPRVLTADFAAARAPAVSFDGRRLLFAGKRRAQDTWQIWEMRTDGSGLRQVTDAPADATDPAYLPDDRIVFSMAVPEEDGRLALFTAGPDGCCLQRITHHPVPDEGVTLMHDGRLLFAAGSAADGDARRLMAIRYDGTGAELFYASPGGRMRGRAREAAGGQVVFVDDGRLVAVEARRPLHTRVDLAPGVPGTFHSAAASPAGALFASYGTAAGEPFGLYRFEDGRPGAPLVADGRYHAVEPVVAGPHPRPLGFVTLVEPGQPSGWFYGIDADHSTLPAAAGAAGPSRHLRVIGTEGVLAEVPLEADGSFHLDVPADVPLRFETLDEAGRTVRGPSDWVWVRPMEMRGCIGCHEDRELAPENRVVLAFDRPAVVVGTRAVVAAGGAAGEEH